MQHVSRRDEASGHQVESHSSQSDLLLVSPGQLGSSLQSWTWALSPGQLLPWGFVSEEGAGLEQKRSRLLDGMINPLIHDPEH